jgi:hypothetical protein
MRIPATPIALTAFFLGMIVVPAAGADRDSRASVPQVALQPAASADAAGANCLVPGQIHDFGSVRTVTPRRAVTLPAADCAARGGEPIATAAVD